MRPRRRFWCWGLPWTLTAACTVAAASPPAHGEGPVPRGLSLPGSPPESAFGGHITLDGRSLEVVLTVRDDGDGRIEGWLRVPDLPLEAQGWGHRSQESLSLQFSYGVDCPGQARIEARARPGGPGFIGRLAATDCTGTEQAPLVLLPRPAR